MKHKPGDKMKTFRTQGAQGDLFFRRITTIPNGLTATKPDSQERIVVAHSETGHHHYLAAIGVEHFQSSDPLVAYLRVSSPAELLHARPFDTHAPILFPPGSYELRRQREHTPAGWRRVED